MASTATADTLQRTDFDLKSYLGMLKQKVDAALEESISARGSEDEKLVSAMRYSLLAGGKRVRPALCIAACAMARKKAGLDVGPVSEPDEDTLKMAMPTAIALEMIHTMSLIHDDLPGLDNDDLRRGKPTCHVKYGESTAILAGDALLSESFSQVSGHTPQEGDAAVSAPRIIEVIRRLADCVGYKGLAAGEQMDLDYEEKEATLEELRWIHRHKTAALLETAVTAGAILGGADLESEVPALEVFANDIGLAFQVHDDILDITGTSEELGKTAGKDVDQMKTTYPKLMGLEGAREEAQRLYKEATGSLEPFGEHATPLLAIAKFIISRRN